MKQLLISILLKRWIRTKRLYIYSLSSLLTPLPLILFSAEEMTGFTTEGANKAPRNPPSSFFVSCFNVSVTPSIHKPKFSNDFITLVISIITSFELNKVNPFPALADPFPLIFKEKQHLLVFLFSKSPTQESKELF